MAHLIASLAATAMLTVPGPAVWHGLLAKPCVAATTGKVLPAAMQLRESADASLRERLDREPASNQVPYQPAEGAAPTVTPPAFSWVPVEDVQEYVLQYSQSPGFPAAQSTTVRHV
ncbi:MAG: hypothetical protein PVH68_20540, partial [Armatimonadota bacterium]